MHHPVLLGAFNHHGRPDGIMALFIVLITYCFNGVHIRFRRRDIRGNGIVVASHKSGDGLQASPQD